MKLALLSCFVILALAAGCASQKTEAPKPSESAPAEMNGSKNNSGTAMEVSEDGKTVTFGNGSGGSAADSDEDDVVSGGTMGMKKEEPENKTVTSGSGGQIVDVGGSIPIR